MNISSTEYESRENRGGNVWMQSEPEESQGNARSADSEPAESQGNARSADSEPAESQGNARSAVSEPAESQGNAQSAVSEPAESQGNARSADSEPAESQGNAQSAVSEPAESQGNARSAESESAASSFHSVGSIVSCRICKWNEGDDLIPSPCRCKGTMGAIHVACLEEWLTGSSRESCELCEAQFNVVRTLKYGLLPSVWVFLRDHVNKARLVRTLFFLAVSLMNTTVLCCLWFAYVLAELPPLANPQDRKRQGFDHISAGNPIRAACYFFVFTLCMFFVAANTADDVARVYYVYCKPWYRWWRSAVDIRLVVDKDPDERPCSDHS